MPLEATDFEALGSLGRKQLLGISYKWDDVEGAVIAEYHDMARQIEDRASKIVDVEQADTPVATIMLAAYNMNYDALEHALGELALVAPGTSAEAIAAYNQMAPLISALSIIEKAKNNE